MKFTGVIKRNSSHLYFFLLFSGFFMVGIVAGSVIATFFNSREIELFAENVRYSAIHYGGEIKGTVVNSAFSVGMLLVLLWCCGFCKKWLGFFISASAVVFKGAVTGYTFAMLMKAFGTRGIVISAASVFPQYIVLLPAVFFAATAAMSFCEMNFTKTKLKKYLILFLIYLAATVICAFADGFAAGKLMAMCF